jgi:hypothetical protein
VPSQQCTQALAIPIGCPMQQAVRLTRIFDLD